MKRSCFFNSQSKSHTKTEGEIIYYLQQGILRKNPFNKRKIRKEWPYNNFAKLL